MRFPFFHYLGGLLWWLIIKFCRTNLDQEQSDDKWIRNVLFTIFIIILLIFLSVKFF